MGIPACILMPRVEYTPEKLLADAVVSSFRANLGFIYSDMKEYKNGRFSYTTFTIREAKNDRAFFCYLYSKENRWNTPFTDYEDVGLDPGLDLCRVGYIEKIANKEDVVFRFAYEYLKINPGHYFYVPDYDLVYTLEDMQKIKESYDPHWCYKDPKTGEYVE
jgi:hypothetical protein